LKIVFVAKLTLPLFYFAYFALNGISLLTGNTIFLVGMLFLTGLA